MNTQQRENHAIKRVREMRAHGVPNSAMADALAVEFGEPVNQSQIEVWVRKAIRMDAVPQEVLLDASALREVDHLGCAELASLCARALLKRGMELASAGDLDADRLPKVAAAVQTAFKVAKDAEVAQDDDGPQSGSAGVVFYDSAPQATPGTPAPLLHDDPQ